MRRAVAGVATVLICISLASPVRADELSSAHKSAQDRANRAAARLAQAQTELAKAQDDVDGLQVRLRQDLTTLAGLQTQVQDLAVRQYMRGEATPLFLFDKDVNRLSRGRAMLRFVTVGDLDAIDRYRAARQDLDAVGKKLNGELKARRAALSSLQSEQKAAMADLERLALAEEAAAARRARQEAASRPAAKPVSR